MNGVSTYRLRWTLVPGSLLLYTLALVLLYPIAGPSAAAIGFLPVMLAAGIFGRAGGYVMVMFVMAVNAAFFNIVEQATPSELWGNLVPAITLLVIAEITARLRAAHDKVVESVRSKDKFLASVSHELRTPLTAVAGFADLLYREQSNLSVSERNEMIRVIAHQAFDVSSIVEDVLVAARAEQGSLEISTVPTDLRAQIAQVLETYERETIAGIRVFGESRRAAGDPARVRQILRNMVSNALRYGGDDIRITIHTGIASVWVAVEDNGSGIPEEEREDIFESYHRAHDAPGVPGSMGLGLFVSRQLARLMGGDLTYRYEDGKSTFELNLPPADQIPQPFARSQVSLESTGTPT